MLEIVQELQNPAIVALAMILTGLIKDQGWLKKVNTRIISVVVSVVLVLLVKSFVTSTESILIVENMIVVILPALGYDYLIKPIMDAVNPKP